MNKRIKIVADDKIPFLKGVLEPYADIFYSDSQQMDKALIKDADALIIRTRTKCDSRLLEGTDVKYIATATIGYDHIDTEYCADAGIDWINAPGCNSSSVRQYIASALLMFAYREKVNLKDLTIGIVGVGSVGRKIAMLAEILEMKILLNDPPRERAEGNLGFVKLDEIKKYADIITLHVPLNYEGEDKTFHLADEKFFESVRSEALIINSSRGAVADNQALKKALNEKKIKAAILDVWENEPEIDTELLKMVYFGTAHIAGYSAEGKANGTAVAVNSVSKFFNLGLPSNWYPEIPLPQNNQKIFIDCSSKPGEEIYEMVTHTYKISEDDSNLKKTPWAFENLRDSYKIRREFPYFSAKLKNCDRRITSKIKELGFRYFK